MEFDAENAFMFAGVVDMGSTFNAALALPEQIFFLSPEARQEMIKAWIELLQGCQHEEFIVELSGEVEEGEMAVIISKDVIETREIPDNVVEFKREN